jgi:hypothetical protein
VHILWRDHQLAESLRDAWTRCDAKFYDNNLTHFLHEGAEVLVERGGIQPVGTIVLAHLASSSWEGLKRIPSTDNID